MRVRFLHRVLNMAGDNLITHRKECKSHYQRNKQYYYERNLRNREAKRRLVRSLKTNPCVDCKISYPHYVMDFDHRGDDIKVSDIATLLRNNAGTARILREIEKCDLVCSNCHRIRTWNRIIRSGVIGSTSLSESEDSRFNP